MKYVKSHYRIKFVPKNKLKDYAGMNYYAGKAMGYNDYPINKNTIIIDASLPKKVRHETIKHEIVEAKLMRKGMSYFEAHKRALQAEKRKAPRRGFAIKRSKIFHINSR